MIERILIQESLKKIGIENYLKKELNKAGFTGIQISKTPLVTRIVLNVTRPGLAIGKGGKNIRILTNEIERQFKVDNPQIEINEIKTPDLDAKATVNKMISLLERGFSWKSVAFRTVDDVIRAGAQGVELSLKGKLAGKGGRKMKQRLAKGYMKRAGSFTALVDYAKGDAYPKAGAIGIKLRIIGPNVVFPDKINMKEFLEKRREEASKAVEGKEIKETEKTEELNAEEEKKAEHEKEEKETGEERKEGKVGKEDVKEKKEEKTEEKEEKAVEKKEGKEQERKTDEKEQKEAKGLKEKEESKELGKKAEERDEKKKEGTEEKKEKVSERKREIKQEIVEKEKGKEGKKLKERGEKKEESREKKTEENEGKEKNLKKEEKSGKKKDIEKKEEKSEKKKDVGKKSGLKEGKKEDKGK